MNAKKMIKTTGRMTANATAATAEYIVKKSALIAAICSTAGTGNYAQRAFSGAGLIVDVFKEPVSAYINNTGFRDMTNAAAKTATSDIGDIVRNAMSDPMYTAQAAAITFAACKTLPMVSKMARKKIIPYVANKIDAYKTRRENVQPLENRVAKYS